MCFKPNTHRRRRHDSTRQLSRVGVGDVYWVLAITAHTVVYNATPTTFNYVELLIPSATIWKPIGGPYGFTENVI